MAARNSPSAALNAAGCSRLARWPAPGKTTKRARGILAAMRSITAGGAVVSRSPASSERRHADPRQRSAAVEGDQTMQRGAIGRLRHPRHAADRLRDARRIGRLADHARRRSRARGRPSCGRDPEGRGGSRGSSAASRRRRDRRRRWSRPGQAEQPLGKRAATPARPCRPSSGRPDARARSRADRAARRSALARAGKVISASAAEPP